MTNLKLTVIMPAYNAEATIAVAIQSMLCQTYSDFELWVLESNSNDRTAEVARSFTDPRVKVFELGSLSFQKALAYGLENAKTEWLARMDADDLSFPERFQEQMKVIEQRPDLTLVGTRCVYLTPFGHIVETRPNVVSREIGPLNLRLLKDDARFFADGSVIFKRSVAQAVGGYDPEFEMGDVPLWFRILSYGKGWEIAQPLYLYRLHPKSISRKIAPSDELHRFLVKYTPDLLRLHYSEESIQNPKPESWHTQQYWLRIAAYEALTGDRKSMLQAVDFLEKDGPLKKEALLMRWFAHLGYLGSASYGWYKRRKYRHRPDLEQSLTSLLGSLTLEREVYAG